MLSAVTLGRAGIVALVALAVPLVIILVSAPAGLWAPYTIPSGSMEPGLRPGDYIVVSKYPYLDGGKPLRGDVVVFRNPKEGGVEFVERLVGLPGDRVQMKQGVLYLNGAAVPREAADTTPDPDGEIGQVYRETLPGGRHYLILERSDKAFLDNTDAFEVPPGCYFFLGDSRDNSIDSRVFTSVGYVPEENLVGRVDFVVFNSEERKLRLQPVD